MFIICLVNAAEIQGKRLKSQLGEDGYKRKNESKNSTNNLSPYRV